MERTFSIIKPNAVIDNNIGNMISNDDIPPNM